MKENKKKKEKTVIHTPESITFYSGTGMERIKRKRKKTSHDSVSRRLRSKTAREADEIAFRAFDCVK